jgi:hypothetical protein
MPLRQRAPVPLLLALLLALASRTMAGTINVVTEVRATLDDRGVTALVRVSNRGDEAATAVVTTVQLGDQERRAEPIPQLAPGRDAENSFQLPIGGVGQWPLITRVD